MLDDVLDRYLPVDVTDDWPESHIEAEGLDIEKEDYFRSLIETASSAVGENVASNLEGLYARNYDVIVLRDQDDEEDLEQVHEHEYIHRLHEYESDRPFRFSFLNTLYQSLFGSEQQEPMDAEAFLEDTWYEPDHWERRIDTDLAERYDEPAETTETIVMPDDFEQEHEDYYAALAFQAIDFIGTGDWYNGLEDGEIRSDLDVEMDDHSEVLTHYLVHVEGTNHESLTERDVIDPDELEPVDEAMQRLD